MKKILFLFLICFACVRLDAKEKTSFSVLQLNLWNEGTKVPDGYQGILDVLDQANADVIFLCEIRNGNQFMQRILEDMEKRGKYYYGETLGLSMGILSKCRPDDIVKCCIIPGDEHRAMLKARIFIGGQPVCFYSAHLDHRHYECYMPRGYSGTTWEKIDGPITDEATVLEANRLSFRDESIRAFLQDAQTEIDKGYAVVLGGDFNEPSHLDWQADTKDLYDHNGAVINWDCSVMLYQAGFKDAYREKHPDPVHYPGFTFPAGNKLAEEAKLEKLVWAPEADERDRIDFIYYYPANAAIVLRKSVLVGPAETVLRGEIIKKDSDDKFFVPDGIWPTDHKGNLTTFKLTPKK